MWTLPRQTWALYIPRKGKFHIINVIVSPGLVVRDGKHLHGGRVLLVDGLAQREAEIINVIAQRVGQIGVG
jgi:hypothetical protein